MATREQLERALRAADAAGDVEAAKTLARALQATPAVPPTSTPSVEPTGGVQPPASASGALPPASPSPEALPTSEKIRRGVAASGIKMGLGLGDIVEKAPVPLLAKALGWKGFMPDEETQKRILTEVEADVAEGGGVSKAAEIGGDIAATVIPGARGYSAIRTGVGAARPILGRALASMGAGGGMGAAVTPGGLEERGQAAAAGAAGGALGEAGGSVLGKTLGQLVKPSKQATELLAEDIVPTVGQGAASKGFKMAEDIVSHIPFAGQIVRGGQDRALTEFRERALEEVFGKGKSTQLLAQAKKLGIEDRGMVDYFNEYVKNNVKGNSPDAKHIREMWRTYKDAASELGSEGGILPKALQAASRRVGGKERFAIGEAPMQDIADPAQILKKSGTGILPTAAGIGVGLGSLASAATSVPTIAALAGATRPVARFAFGDYAWQRALRDALRRSTVPATAGAITGREIEED